MWQQQDLNPQPLSSKMNNQPFGQNASLGKWLNVPLELHNIFHKQHVFSSQRQCYLTFSWTEASNVA